MKKIKNSKLAKVIRSSAISIILLTNKVNATDIVSEVEGGGQLQQSKLGQGIINIIKDITGTMQWILPITGVCFLLFYVFKIMTRR